MSLRLSSLGLGVFVVALVATGLACQTYDFEPVEPLAIAQVSTKVDVKSLAAKPNIMLVVDQSGSMMDPVDKGAPNCGNCGFGTPTPVCPSNCPTRITDMKQAMEAFLISNGHAARFGLNVYPPSTPGEKSVDVCGSGNTWLDISASVDVDAELSSHSQQVNTLIQGIRPEGGTPIGATLQALADHAALNQPDGRDDFVLLLTDGLPNCNSDLSPATCTCTLLNPSTQQPYQPCPSAQNCLDQDRVVSSIQALRQKDIRTIVVAFGADVTGSLALPPLNAMAEAGGFPRACQTADDCGGGETCDGATDEVDGVCSVKFYRAENAADLADALDKIRRVIGDKDPCLFEMNANPEDERFIVVLIDGEKQTSGADTWAFTRGAAETSLIQMQGALCNRILNASELTPVSVEIRIVEAL